MTPIQLALATALWLCFGVVGYVYVGYPVVVWLLARVFGRHRRARSFPDAELPTVSLVVAAYNEEHVIDGRVRNALALDYPADKLEVIIATDGCADRTAEVAMQYADRGVRVLEFAERRGKAAVLNDALAAATGDVVVLSDANTMTERPAARRLAEWFRDPGVSAVCGKLVLTDPATGGNVDGMYWKYETFLKKCEGRLGALLGANGGIYAIRKSVYVPLPAGTVLDDMVIPLLARLRHGGAIVYDPRAVAHEETAPDIGSEFHRRSRIGAGGFGSLGLVAGLLNPLRGWVAFTFLSHKVLRWCCPFFLIGLFVANLALWPVPEYRPLLAAQVAFYLTAWVASFVPSRFRAFKVLRLTTMFTAMNGALFIGFVRWVRRSQTGTWRRTDRPAAALAGPSVGA